MDFSIKELYLSFLFSYMLIKLNITFSYDHKEVIYDEDNDDDGSSGG